jgi:type II secretory pathway predicted ATPase ExeA
MYETFFGLVNRPFLAIPTLDRYFPATTMEQTFQMATRAISRAEGPVAVFGGTGLGKTMFCLRVSEHFRRSYDVVMLASSQLITRRALLQSLLFELRMPYRNMNEGELRLTLMNRLQPTQEFPSQGLLLVIDEAQTLSPKLLDEIRLLTNITRDGMPRVRLVLCGTMKLEDILSHPQMESLNQRLSCRCYLTPLTPQETANYVAHKIELCGVSASSAITRDAMEAIYRGSDGIPRLIDQLADQSLLLAAQERQRPVSAALVGKAWGMLQQLPNPWSEPESISLPTKSQASVEQPINQVSTESTSVRVSSSPAGQAQPTDAAPKATLFRNIPVESLPFMTSFIEPKPIVDDIIEFGTLDDSEGPTQQSFEDTEYKLAPAPRVASNHSEIVSAPIVPESIAPESTGSASQHRNLLDVFGADFDEEFSLPVQSSPGYQTYSGVAFGNLRDDVSGLDRDKPTASYTLPEAKDFFEVPAAPAMAELETRPAWAELPREPVRVPTHPVMLEKQIEDEMREIVSDLNLNAMMFDPMRPIAKTPEAAPVNRFSEPMADESLSFAAVSRNWSGQGAQEPAPTYHDEESMFSPRSSQSTARRPSLGDDRDLLVIEEDIESVRSSSQREVPAPHRPVMHPYAKLFSNLR